MGKSYFGKNKFTYMRNKLIKPKFLSSNKCLSSKIFYPELPEFLQVIHIDPGSSSCGIRIVRYYLESKEMILIWFSVIDFGNNTCDINEKMHETFTSLIPYLLDCHHVVIEHQIMKCELTYRCFSAVIYFITSQICPFKMKPILIEVDCKLKTSFLGGPRTKCENNSQEMKEFVFNKTKKWPENGTIEIKEWTKMKSRQFSIERGDLISYNILNNSLYKPNEDLSDTLCYEYAWVPYILSRDDIFLPFKREMLL